MRVVGRCKDCKQMRPVTVSGNAFALSVARGDAVEGLCDPCETKRSRHEFVPPPIHGNGCEVCGHWRHHPWHEGQ